VVAVRPVRRYGSPRATSAEAASPVSQLINDFGPPVSSPALQRQRAAMPSCLSSVTPWDLRDRHGKEMTPDVPETARWLLDHGMVGQHRRWLLFWQTAPPVASAPGMGYFHLHRST